MTLKVIQALSSSSPPGQVFKRWDTIIMFSSPLFLMLNNYIHLIFFQKISPGAFSLFSSLVFRKLFIFYQNQDVQNSTICCKIKHSHLLWSMYYYFINLTPNYIFCQQLHTMLTNFKFTMNQYLPNLII